MNQRHQWTVRVDDEADPQREIWRCRRCAVWRMWERDADGVLHEVYHSATITRVMRAHADETKPGDRPRPPRCGEW